MKSFLIKYNNPLIWAVSAIVVATVMVATIPEESGDPPPHPQETIEHEGTIYTLRSEYGGIAFDLREISAIRYQDRGALRNRLTVIVGHESLELLVVSRRLYDELYADWMAMKAKKEEADD